MKINIIVARSLNRVIGKDGKIPWSIPEDMKRFKELTMGHPVIMGRKTWESLPEQYRPLPERSNIVLSSDTLYKVPTGVLLCSSLKMALDFCRNTSVVWVIGGSSLYKEALPLADTIEETVVYNNYDGDTFIAPFGYQWRETARVSIYSEKAKMCVDFVTRLRD